MAVTFANRNNAGSVLFQNFTGAGNMKFETRTATVSGQIRVLIAGDTNNAAISASLGSRLKTLGYTSSISVQTLGTTYTGADINTGSYDVVVYYTNSGQTGATTLTSNLRSFQNAGGGVVYGTFVWNLKPVGFDYTLTPLQSLNNQGSSNGNTTIVNSSPVLNNYTSSFSGGSTILINTFAVGTGSLQPGATLNSQYSTGSAYPAVVTTTSGSNSARIVGINAYLGYVPSYAAINNLLANAVLWSANKI